MISASLNKQRLLAYAGLTLAPLFWAGNAVLATSFVQEIPPISLSFWRWLFALAILLPVSFLSLIKEKNAILSKLPHIFCLASFSVVAFSTLLYQAATTSNATNIGLINSTIPIFILIIGAVYFRKKISMEFIAGISIAVVGVYWIISRGNLSLIINHEWVDGDLQMLIAVICWAIYSILLKSFDLKLSKKSLLTSQVLAGLTILTPFMLLDLHFGSGGFSFSNHILSAFTYIAIFPGILAYVFWSFGISVLGPSRSGIFMYLIPLFSAALSFYFLGDKIHSYHIYGGLLILIGLYLSTREPVYPPARK